jgi:hypothetical protein
MLAANGFEGAKSRSEEANGFSSEEEEGAGGPRM